MTATFEPPTWTAPPGQPAEPVPAPAKKLTERTVGLVAAVALAIAALLVGYTVGHDRGERDAIQACQDATPGIVSDLGRLVGPSGGRLVTCTVPKR